MEHFFASLSRAVEGSPAIALGAAVVWGILSIVLSPCHLASLPLIVGFISGQGRISVGRAFAIASSFAVGILVTIATLGGVTAAAGRVMGDVGRWGNYVVAAVFFAAGLSLLGVLPPPWSAPEAAGLKKRGIVAAFVLGVLFGIALGPCTFAFMAPLLAIALKQAHSAPLYSASLLLAYGVGHCGVIALAGSSTELAQRVLNWNEKGLHRVKVICGTLVLAGGIWLIYSAP